VGVAWPDDPGGHAREHPAARGRVSTTVIELAWAPAIIFVQVAFAYVVAGHPSVRSH
jgi:hypothetical protein